MQTAALRIGDADWRPDGAESLAGTGLTAEQLEAPGGGGRRRPAQGSSHPAAFFLSELRLVLMSPDWSDTPPPVPHAPYRCREKGHSELHQSTLSFPTGPVLRGD